MKAELYSAVIIIEKPEVGIAIISGLFSEFDVKRIDKKVRLILSRIVL